MNARVAIVPMVLVLVAGCAGDAPAPPEASPSTPAPATPAPTTPSAIVTTPATPATPTVTDPTPSETSEATAEGYVAPVFEAQERVATAADPAAFADVNPIDYRNPWR